MITTKPIEAIFPAQAVQDARLHPLRMIVLVPDQLLDPAAFSQTIYHMAFQQRREVLYLTLSDARGDLLARDRQMADLKALTEDATLKVGMLSLSAADWVEAVRFVYQPGDLVVCHEAQKVREGWRRWTSLAHVLDEQYHMRVHLLEGFISAQETEPQPFWTATMLWLASLATLVLFTFLEMNMEVMLTGGIKTLILIVLVCVEFGVFFKLLNINHY